ncbi:hypothetical protein PMAYCL1PPCAC_27088 [Pristionchus mayeri]|uniref:BTB domain-containing protein n=1 Tax=Pristionchus mayeri TaxID=1317129 RepID=A0AAN5I8U0_9BILA|nr:hypothetical protein PMAYCL1PPCAC_27088 [Pristionchus mayeri]
MSESTQALLERIRQLEMENKDVKERLHRLVKREQPGPLCSKDQFRKHEFKIELRRDSRTAESRVLTWKFGERRGRDQTFHLARNFRLKNTNKSQPKFVIATLDVGQKNVDGNGPHTFTKACPTLAQQFPLCADDKELSTCMPFHLSEGYANCGINFYARLSIVVEDLESIDPDEDATVVVVKEKEFLVSAKYLSIWSRYFRAYFNADMREKREGRYPISDADIFPVDFRELLMVIQPTQKPISQHNYYRLLELAQRFEMPELTRKIELFLIDFERNELDRAHVFRISTDVFQLKLVQSALMHRWADMDLLKKELVETEEYPKLLPNTKIFVNERFVQSFIGNEPVSEVSGAERRESSQPPTRGVFQPRPIMRNDEYDDYGRPH